LEKTFKAPHFVSDISMIAFTSNRYTEGFVSNALGRSTSREREGAMSSTDRFLLDGNLARTKKEVEEMVDCSMRTGVFIQNIDYLDNIENYKRFQGVYLQILYDCKDGVNGRDSGLLGCVVDFGEKHDLNRIFDEQRFLERKQRFEKKKKHSE
jgi:hypothetical protein